MRLRHNVFGAALLLHLAAVAAAQVPGNPFAVAGEVTVTHTASDRWRVEYELSRDAVSIMLGPPTPEYHAGAWRLPEAFHVTVDETGYAYLERVDGEAFRGVAVEVQTWSDLVTYAPQPFGVFSDGVAINTGPLGFASRIGPNRMMMTFAPTFTFRGMPDESVVVPGVQPGSLEHLDLPDSGVFVYFGSTGKMRRSESLDLLLDGDAPQALGDLVFESAKGYAELYDHELRDALAGPLVVFFSWSEGESLGFGGGAQGNQIMAKGRGPANLEVDDAARRAARSFLAHEMAHVWQTHLGNDDARWWNEGGAELLALRAMEGLGEETAVGIAADLSARVGPALEGLRRTSLFDAHRRGDPELNYSAGTLVMAAAEAATAADEMPDDVFALDRALSAIGPGDRRGSPMRSFRAALRTLGASEAACEAIETFVTSPHGDPRAALLALFDATGLRHHLDGDSVLIDP